MGSLICHRALGSRRTLPLSVRRFSQIWSPDKRDTPEKVKPKTLTSINEKKSENSLLNQVRKGSFINDVTKMLNFFEPHPSFSRLSHSYALFRTYLCNKITPPSPTPLGSFINDISQIWAFSDTLPPHAPMP